jgi:hypothetical protein
VRKGKQQPPISPAAELGRYNYKMIIQQINHALFIIFLLASISEAGQINFKKQPLKPYNDKLSLNLMMSGNEKGTGYYSTDEKGTLDGPLQIESKRSGYDKQVETNYSFETAVAGNFKDGMKDGIWEYQYVYDDGVDLYEAHKIEIEYKDHKCIRSSFEGVIGYTMPKTRHTFESQQYCTPQAIRNRAWEIWRAEFEKSNEDR